METLTCPCCKASHPLVPNPTPACRRCKADLTLVWSVALDQAQWVDQAVRAFHDQNYHEAARMLDCALALQRTPRAARWRLLTALALGDSTTALSYTREAGLDGVTQP